MVYIVLGNALFGLLLRRMMVAYHLDFVQQRIPVLIGGVIAVLTTLALSPTLLDAGSGVTFDFAAQLDITQETTPAGVLLAPIALASYSRGSSAGRYPPAPETVTLRGRLGIAVFFLTALASERSMQSDMAVLLPMFFGAMLLASAMSRAATLKLSSEGRKRHLGGSWFGFLLLSTLTVVLLSLLVSALLGGVNEEQVRAILAIPFTIVIGLLIIVTSPFAYVVSYLIGQFDFADEAPPQEDIVAPNQETPPSADNPQIDIGDEIRAVFSFLTDSLLISMALIAIVAVVVFWVAFFLLPENQNLDEETREDIGDREKVGNIGNALARQFRKLGDALNNLTQFGAGRDLFAAFTVRWAYTRMERMGKKRGFPRIKSQTPYEYQTQLHQAFPGGGSSVKTITNAYVAIRYGEVPENEQELNAVRDALDHLKTLSASSK